MSICCPGPSTEDWRAGSKFPEVTPEALWPGLILYRVQRFLDKHWIQIIVVGLWSKKGQFLCVLHINVDIPLFIITCVWMRRRGDTGDTGDRF